MAEPTTKETTASFNLRENRGMQSARAKAMFWRIVFSIAYTGVVLPFTVTFISSVIPPTDDVYKPLIIGFYIALPLFLGAIEFASVMFATLIWHTRRGYILVPFFLSLQLLPMFSVYYDKRNEDYNAEKKSYLDEYARTRDLDSLKQIRLNDANEKSRNVWSDERQRHETELGQSSTNHTGNNQVASDILSRIRDLDKTLPPAYDTSSAAREQRKHVWQEQADLRKQLGSIADNNKAIVAQTGIILGRTHIVDSVRMCEAKIYRDSLVQAIACLKAKEDTLATTLRAKYFSPYDYILVTVGDARSRLIALITLIFPFTLFAIGRILPGSNGKVIKPVINVRRHLSSISRYVGSAQITMAKNFLPVLMTSIVNLRSSKRMADQTIMFDIKEQSAREVAQFLQQTVEDIQNSKLDRTAKDYLTRELCKAILKEFRIALQMRTGAAESNEDDSDTLDKADDDEQKDDDPQGTPV